MNSSVLGISAFYHDSAAALLIDGEIVAAAHAERFTRIKHDASFPALAVQYVLAEAGIKVSDLSAIAFYDKPYLKFERLLETYHAFAPKGLRSFLSAMPVWIKEKLFMRRMLWEELEKIEGEPLRQKPELFFPEHHLSHAASCFYPSPFDDAAILTIDGVGEWATTTIGHGKGNAITIFQELPFPHSIGLLYSAFTYYCGFRVNSGEYKLMGLAPYGIIQGEHVKRYKDLILRELVDIREDGSILLNMKFFDYATGLRMCNDRKWQELFGLPKRESESEFTQPYMDMALAIQQITEDVVLRLAKTARKLTNSRNIVLAGGVALNCVANGKLLRTGIYDDLWIQPAAGDAGGALGAAYAVHYIGKNKERRKPQERQDAMQGSYLGPEFSETDIKRLVRKYEAENNYFNDFSILCTEVAKLLDQGKIVGWFQGRMEWGPRALGNRSILGDSRNPEMQKKLNLKIKYREGFRPFAPSVLEEDLEKYFDLSHFTPYMQLVAPVQGGICNLLPNDYDSQGMYERLYHNRSTIPAVTHVDFSARIQSVSRKTNERYWSLINAFKDLTGCSVIVNTSFNVRGEPIVCTPEDAYRCFMRTEMDYLVLGNYFFDKKTQHTLPDDTDWKKEFELD
ncbi:MAG: carbamoyltransferase [Desulfobacteraceae bacterium]|nr:carbamoyltransferase [Desulfobacteraceae bacterium]MBC2754834.1 carbamoyltransferase [Desulfobacteraceae bacterium]